MKILALDDDEDVLKAVKIILNLAGHEVHCVEDAAVAVDMLQAVRYDLVLFDYRMPERDGIWFLRNARFPCGTKAVLMTAYGTRELIDRMFRLGAAGYLMKPFTADDLLRHVEFHAPASPGAEDRKQDSKATDLQVTAAP